MKGKVSGLVTIEDVLEQIVGDIGMSMTMRMKRISGNMVKKDLPSKSHLVVSLLTTLKLKYCKMTMRR